ncbi:MAG: hypothetical protein ABL311_04795 [Nitratireductor rhodophyticola]|uniref:hypothetical protein n=1 Tax=Nitratireductor rhodophyticola TaxID=2854036 RepID=UPI0032D99E1E
MVRIENALTELREMVGAGRSIDEAYCRRLLLRATSAIPNLQLAAELCDRAGTLIATLEMTDALGGERPYQADMIMDVLVEIEEASRPQ